MSRIQLIRGILLSYFCLLLMGGLWVNSTLSASEPLSDFTVQGASTDQSTSQTNPQLKAYPVISSSKATVYTGEYALYDVESGKTLLRSTEMKPVAIASTTKLMTTHLVVQYLEPERVITVSTEAAGQIGSLMNIVPGEKISVKNLLYGALMVSGNDAVFALAEEVGGQLLNNPQADSKSKIDRFVLEMNKEAKRLHMTDTQYKDPAGLNDEGHSTAVDLAKLMSVDMTQPLLHDIMTTATTTVYDQPLLHRYDLRNSNRLVTDYQYPGLVGGKTGYTPEAGHCLITAVTRNGHTLIASILHTTSDTADASAVEAKRLLDIGFTSVTWQ